MNEESLMRIAKALEQIAQAMLPENPCYRRPLAFYADFDFSEIGAEVLRSDQVGATYIQWGGHIWKRRASTGKFGEAIWFSRATGKGDDGGTDYACLIKFQNMGDVEPVPPGLVVKVSARKNKR